MNTKAGAFDAATSELGSDVAALFGNEGEFSFIPLDMIKTKPQVREVFDGLDSSMLEMIEDVKKRGILQPILLRETDDGYELIAGERRFRAALGAGLKNIPAFIRVMTDEEAREAQLAENIHRLNLSQIELAKRVQADLDALGGDVPALLAKYNKSPSWLSKVLVLLKLEPQAQRLVAENISADLEVISAVNNIEKKDINAAKELVDSLKGSKGQASARKAVKEAKDKVKPPKAKKNPPKADKKPSPAPAAQQEDNPETALLKKVHLAAMQGTLRLSKKDRDMLELPLKTFHERGGMPQDAGRSILDGFNQGIFAHGDFRELHLAAYAYGLKGAEFSIDMILNSVK